MRLLAGGLALGVALFLGEQYLRPLVALLPALREEALLLLLLVTGTAIYGALVVALIGRNWLKQLMRDTGVPPVRPETPAAD
jgi:hypothetical protein